MISNGQSEFLNIIRWSAAGLVVIEHARSLLFCDFGSIAAPNAFHRMFYLLSGFGHEAVVLFFVVSGFLVGGKIVDQFKRDDFVWRKYLIDRVSRLYAVLFVAIVLGAVLDWVGVKLFNDFGFYTHQAHAPVAVVRRADFSQRLDLAHAICSLAMLQEIVLPSFGSNGPLWSLAHEWWYYLLFPVVMTVVVQRRVQSGRFWLSALMVIGLFAFLPSKIVIMSGLWLAGVVAFMLNGRRAVPAWVALPLFIGSLIPMRLELVAIPYLGHYVVAIGFCLLLNSLVDEVGALPLSRLSSALAGFSYSLYLVHFPLILLVTAALFQYQERTSRMQPTLDAYALFFAIVGLSYICSWAVAQLTESKTQQVRGWLTRALSLRTFLLLSRFGKIS